MTAFSRIFMIFYALIGIPLNGIVMVNLGKIFGRQVSKDCRIIKFTLKNSFLVHKTLPEMENFENDQRHDAFKPHNTNNHLFGARIHDFYFHSVRYNRKF